MKISVLFVNLLDDKGFNASAFTGVEAEQLAGRHDIKVVHGIPWDETEIAKRMEEAAENSDFVIFVGGQGDTVAPKVALQYPNKRFAVIQGSVTGPNLFSYEVKQEESAFLAGILAAMSTRTGIVGHLSGNRVKPGLKGRAAYAAGVRYARKDVRLLTSFCGDQDDNAIVKIWIDSQIDAGADVIFTMLNAGRFSAIDSCRARKVHQIGNATDWCAKDPDVFIGSAIAHIGLAVRSSIADAEADRSPVEPTKIGFNDDNAVSLSLREDITTEVRAAIANAEKAVKSGTLTVPDSYDGPEFVVASPQ